MGGETERNKGNRKDSRKELLTKASSGVGMKVTLQRKDGVTFKSDRRASSQLM